MSGDELAFGCPGFFFCQDLERIWSFIILPSSNRINFGLCLFFTTKVIDWSKITINLIFCEKFYQHFTVPGAYALRRIFFILENISAQATSGEFSSVLLIGIAIILFVR